MIEFEHKLPSMSIGGRLKSGTYNNYDLAMPGVLTTTDPKLGLFLYELRNEIGRGRSLVFIDGKIANLTYLIYTSYALYMVVRTFLRWFALYKEQGQKQEKDVSGT